MMIVTMFAARLSQGDTIGIICPSHIMEWSRYERIVEVIERLGFKVEFGDNAKLDTDKHSLNFY